MQQLTPISVLPASSGGAAPASSMGAVTFDESGSQALNINGFGKVFQTVSADSEGTVVQGQGMSWQAFTQQYPELMEQLGEEFDIEAFFAQFQFDGQSFSFDASTAGELLPPGFGKQAGNVLGQMTAWFKQSGIELTLDETGQIVPVDFNSGGMGQVGMPLPEGEANAKGLMEKITAAINQFVGSLQSDSEVDASNETQPLNLTGVQLAQGQVNSGQKVVDPVIVASQAANAPALGATLNAAGPNTDAAATLNGVSETVTTQLTNQQGFSNQGGGQQGQQGQSETDAQFKAFLNGQVSETISEEAGDLLQPKAVETAGQKFSEIQSKIQGAALRQYSTGVSTPVQDPAWADQMSQKIVWMTGRNIQSAEIHLNPAELGPVEVKISVQNEQAAITFNVQHATVRELLESNVTRLREMMDANGVELAEVDVANDQDQAQYSAAEGDQNSEDTPDEQLANGSNSGADESDESVAQESGVGLVDYYA